MHVITVVDIRADKVRLGITSPDGCPIHRAEIAEAIYREASARGENPPPVPVVRRKGGAA